MSDRIWHKGEKAFRIAKPMLLAMSGVLYLFPRFLLKELFEWTRGIPGYLGVAVRYPFLIRLFGSVGDNIAVMHNVTFAGDVSTASFGSHISLWSNTWIDCDGLKMGSHVMLSHNSSIISAAHVYDIEGVMMRDAVLPGPVIIGDNVWIGAGARIIGPVVIGSNVIIAANALVTKDIEDNCVVSGVPAKIIKRIGNNYSPIKISK
ncbi:acyltransferase [Sulfuricurvum sp.]|uniref:acyltransferase n=1 Tax=Sulfuricurvum sp. TaxID=2025608 RepID=UPI003BB60621